MYNPIKDHIDYNLSILFVGFNPSIVSSQIGHHYANPTNRFWKILFEAGLTPRRFNPTEDAELLVLGYGLTNIVERPTKSADEIEKAEYDEGREQLKKKIEIYRPKIVCFVGKGVYQQYSKKKKINWGIQENGVVDGVIDFVAPSSSGLVRMKMDDIIEIFRELKKLVLFYSHQKE